VALVSSRVCEGLARHGDELPLISARAEVELEDAWCAELHALHVGVVGAVVLTPARRAAGPYDELTDAVRRVRVTVRGYWAEALVAVGVSREYDLSALIVEDPPEGLYLRGIATGTGGVERVVEVGEGAPSRVVGEIVAQPASLRRAATAASHPVLVAVAVEGHDVPASSIVAVVAPAGPPCPPSEVVEIGPCPCGEVIMVARRGSGALLVRAPGGLVAVSKLLCCAGGLDVVP
jgi:hypothetical protein